LSLDFETQRQCWSTVAHDEAIFLPARVDNQGEGIVINLPTVLILGAGASKPRGFPTGGELLAQARAQELHGLVEMIKPAPASSARPLFEAISGTGEKSLDAMLEHRPALVEAGKALMARALLYREESALGSRQDAPGEWYRDLWGAMSTGSLADFRRNKVTVLTYNYDRSLEFFLITALCERFQKSRTECAAALDCIGPIHLHGQLGFLPELASNVPAHVLYGCAGEGVTPSNVQIAAQNIKIIHEANPQEDVFIRARAALADAKKVVFLGFGFAEQNVTRLTLKTCLDPSTPIYACAKGFTRKQVEVNVKPLFREWSVRQFGEEDWDIAEFLRHYPEALA
jgi:hypothetical protein